MVFILLQNRPYPSCSPPIFLSNGYRSSLPRGKRPGRETDYSPPSGADVINEWCYTPTSLYAFMMWIGTSFYFHS